MDRLKWFDKLCQEKPKPPHVARIIGHDYRIIVVVENHPGNDTAEMESDEKGALRYAIVNDSHRRSVHATFVSEATRGAIIFSEQALLSPAGPISTELTAYRKSNVQDLSVPFEDLAEIEVQQSKRPQETFLTKVTTEVETSGNKNKRREYDPPLINIVRITRNQSEAPPTKKSTIALSGHQRDLGRHTGGQNEDLTTALADASPTKTELDRAVNIQRDLDALPESERSVSSGKAVPSQLPSIAAYLADQQVIELDSFRVLGRYLRYDPAVRNDLRTYTDEIIQIASDKTKWKALNNTLISGLPGQGKTGIVEVLAEELSVSELPVAGRAVYKEFRLDRGGEAELLGFIEEVRQDLDKGNLVVALVDEIDSKEEERWPLDSLLRPLEWNEKDGKPVIWFCAGSKGNDKVEFLSRIQARSKGRDFLSRFPQFRKRVPDLDSWDMMAISCSRILHLAKESKVTIHDVETRALLYLADSEDARQVNHRVRTAIGNVSKGSRRLYFDSCFAAGSTEKKKFSDENRVFCDLLEDKYVKLR